MKTASQGSTFRIDTEPLDGMGLLAVTGELDLATAPRLREAIDTFVEAGVQRLVIDLSAVDFVDSVALAVLVRTRQRLGDHGELALVVQPESYGMLIFEASGIANVLPLFDTRAEAVAHLKH